MQEQIDIDRHFIDPTPTTVGHQAASDLLALGSLYAAQKLSDIIEVKPINYTDMGMSVDNRAQQDEIAAWKSAVGQYGEKAMAIDAALSALITTAKNLNIDPRYLAWGMRSIGLAGEAAKQEDPISALMHIQQAKGMLNQGLAVAEAVFGK
jgi:hypothetical protein